MADIESLLKEKRVFEPAAGVREAGELDAEAGRRRTASSARGAPSASGRRWRRSTSAGSRPGRRCSTGSRPSRSGSSAASSTSPTTASTGTSRARTPGAATRRRSSGRASPATRASLTYGELHREVCRFANVLQGARRREGRPRRDLHADDPRARDRDARLRAHRRAAHVVFGGFSAEALRDRINDAEAKLVITADGGYRRGAAFPLKATVDEALRGRRLRRERRRACGAPARRRDEGRAATSGGTS